MSRRIEILLFCAVIQYAAVLGGNSAHAQQMTLDEAISTARSSSVEALEARNSFITAYWAYRSYEASRLPSLNLYGTLFSFDRSLTLLQDYSSGKIGYASSYNLTNTLGLSIVQNVTATGGQLSLYSDLSRIDQYGDVKGTTWYSQPVNISYTQPIFSYNKFKWEKKISPKEYEAGKRKYIESMEDITIEAVSYFFNLMLAKENYTIAQSNYSNTSTMRSIAGERMKLGRITKDEILQLDLKVINDSIAINDAYVKVREDQMILNSLLGLGETSEIEPVLEDALPSVYMDYETVLGKSLENSSFRTENDISLLNAASDVAKAKADRGITVSLSALFGLSKSGTAMDEAYRSPKDQEVVGLTFNIPIFDWGLGKGKVQKAKAAQEVAKAKVIQSENDYRRKIFTIVGQFNSQRRLCASSRKAKGIANERYSLVLEKFRRGNASVTDLINAQSEKDSAEKKYVTDVSNFWVYYYTVRQLTLFDFIGNKNIDVSFADMIEK